MRAVLVLASIALFSCSQPEPPEPPSPARTPAETATPAPAPPSAEQELAALDRTREAAKGLGGTLKAALVAELSTNGPVAAASVCSDQAVPLTAQVVQETGVTVGRSSLRLRNPDNAPPDWVMAWLAGQGERKAEDSMGFARVEQADGAHVARVLVPLAVEAPCLLCHGSPETLAPGIPELLAEGYPQDRAVGYALGDLRGALWAEGPVR